MITLVWPTAPSSKSWTRTDYPVVSYKLFAPDNPSIVGHLLLSLDPAVVLLQKLQLLLSRSFTNKMLEWPTRCLPGFSIIALGLLLALAFSDLLRWQIWAGAFPVWMDQPFRDGWWSGLSLAQSVFVVYSVLIHIQMFGFTCRLGWTMFRVTAKVKETLLRRPMPSAPSSPNSRISDEGYASQQLSPIALPSPSPFNEKINQITLDGIIEVDEEEVVHAIILPNYCEDLHTLETTLRVLECHPRAQSQYEVGSRFCLVEFDAKLL